MNINFVFDTMFEHRTFKANIIDVSTNADEIPNWYEWGTHIHRHLPWDKKVPTKHSIEFISVDEVIENVQQPDTLNIYPIFCHSTALAYPWPLIYLSRRVIELINSNKLKVLLSCTFENCPENVELMIYTLHLAIKRQGIKRSDNIILACTDFKFQEQIEKGNHLSIFEDLPKPKFVNLDIYQTQTFQIIQKFWSNYQLENFLDVYDSGKPKEKVFLYLNGRPVEWRYLLFKSFEMEGLLSESIYSFRNSATAKKVLGDIDVTTQHWIKYHKPLAEFIKVLPNIAERQLSEKHKENFHWAPLEVGCYMEKDWIRKTYFSIVTETHIGPYTSQVTEKINKLFYYCHPFIVLGSKGVLAEVRRLGYKTFPMLFDESYDEMDYGFEKIKFITDQVKQYTTPEGKKKLESLMPQLRETLAHNRERFISQDIYDKYANLK